MSKSGISTSVGTRGAWFTIGHGKTRETVGLPGTGISYTEQQSTGASPADDGAPAPPSGGSYVPVCVVLLVLIVIAIVIWVR